MNKHARTAFAVLAALAASQALAAGATLRIESWRNDDADTWNDKIIPAFTKAHPDIKVVFAPTPPADYNASLNAKLAGGTAGDLITCRPFDASLEMYKKGQLLPVNDLKGMASFDEIARLAWSTDDGKTTFCVPLAAVLHGFIYNKDAFAELKLAPPKTLPEFMEVLKKIKADGRYVPMALGTAEQWEAATVGFQNIGPDFWAGEAGRKALIAGTQKFTDPQYVAVWKELAAWGPYLGDGYKAQKNADSQNLFALGRAAIYPAGSWDIPVFNQQVAGSFAIGAFPPPLPKAGDTCYISDHTDMGIGINAASKNPEAAKVFLEWLTTPEFAALLANHLPGFFPLARHKIAIEDPVAREFASWRETCQSTIRNSYQILSRGTPNLENQLWNVSAQVVNGTLSPEQAAKTVQDGLDKWYKPAR